MIWQHQSFLSERNKFAPSNHWNMSKSSQLACNLLMMGILLLITRSTQAASLIISSGQTVQLGLLGVTTNYSYTIP